MRVNNVLFRKSANEYFLERNNACNVFILGARDDVMVERPPFQPRAGILMPSDVSQYDPGYVSASPQPSLPSSSPLIDFSGVATTWTNQATPHMPRQPSHTISSPAELYVCIYR